MEVARRDVSEDVGRFAVYGTVWRTGNEIQRIDAAVQDRRRWSKHGAFLKNLISRKSHSLWVVLAQERYRWVGAAICAIGRYAIVPQKTGHSTTRFSLYGAVSKGNNRNPTFLNRKFDRLIGAVSALGREGMPGMPRFDSARPLGAYPFVRLELKKESIPLDICLEAFNPFHSRKCGRFRNPHSDFLLAFEKHRQKAN